MRHPLLLLPRPLDQFVLGDHARELIDGSGGSAALAGRVPYGALLRSPAVTRGAAASTIGRAIRASIPHDWAPDDTVLIAYHAIQWPVVEWLLDQGAAREVWYCRWDRYESAHDAGRSHELLATWHEALAARSTLTFAVSGALAELETQVGRAAIVVGLSADAFPSEPLVPGGRGAELVAAEVSGRELRAPDGHAADGTPGSAPDSVGSITPPDGRPAAAAALADLPGGAVHPAPVAVSLGHLGRRTDWRWLRAAIERMDDLELLLIGVWHENEVGHDDDYHWLRGHHRVVWLGSLGDEDAAAVIAQADVGLIPFTVDPFNDAGLPTRILKYARLGRATISPRLAGAQTWERAVTFVDDPSDLVTALRRAAGTRFHPDDDLRDWALEQTAAKMNAPLHELLRA